jgi:hypothetical protein
MFHVFRLHNGALSGRGLSPSALPVTAQQTFVHARFRFKNFNLERRQAPSLQEIALKCLLPSGVRSSET